MKTKELIKMLQDIDPSGECHVRVSSGMPFFCERKTGFWDGPYEYIEDDTMVFSTKDEKIDIHSMSTMDWVERHLEIGEIRLDLNMTMMMISGKKELLLRWKRKKKN